MNTSEHRVIQRILMVTREYDGLAGAGGVKDVCRQLAEALVRHANCEVWVVLPLYGFMDAAALGFERTATFFTVDMNYPDRERRETVALWMKTIRGVTVCLFDSPRFAEKQGVYTYTEEEEVKKSWQKAGAGHFDYFAMNILLQKAALEMMVILDFRPDVIHCHDGHAATLPAIMRESPELQHFFRQTGAVVTIHNAGIGYHQEVADLDFACAVTGLPESVIHSNLLNDSFDPFVAASGYAHINTVSENYARELQESNEDRRTGGLGHELLKKGVHLAGITNGINPEDFDPQNAEGLGLDASFDPASGDLAGKRICKERMLSSCRVNSTWSLVEQYGSLREEADLPLFTFIGRLTAQKGVDVLLRTVSLLTAAEENGFQLLVLGTGDKDLEKQLRKLAAAEKMIGLICFLKGYDPVLAMKIYAAGDFFLIPSLYEPCGLTDYISQLLGSLPVVHHVGGLVKVQDGETGFAYQEHRPESLAKAMRQALNLHRHDQGQLTSMRQAAVQQIRHHHSWQQVMMDYLEFYRQALPNSG